MILPAQSLDRRTVATAMFINPFGGQDFAEITRPNPLFGREFALDQCRRRRLTEAGERSRNVFFRCIVTRNNFCRRFDASRQLGRFSRQDIESVTADGRSCRPAPIIELDHMRLPSRPLLRSGDPVLRVPQEDPVPPPSARCPGSRSERRLPWPSCRSRPAWWGQAHRVKPPQRGHREGNVAALAVQIDIAEHVVRDAPDVVGDPVQIGRGHVVASWVAFSVGTASPVSRGRPCTITYRPRGGAGSVSEGLTGGQTSRFGRRPSRVAGRFWPGGGSCGPEGRVVPNLFPLLPCRVACYEPWHSVSGRIWHGQPSCPWHASGAGERSVLTALGRLW